MPVVVSHASGPLGDALIPVLLERGSEVRAIVRDRGAAERARRLGAKVTARGLDDADAIRTAVRDAHTVIHTADFLFPPDELIEAWNLGWTERLVDACDGTRVARFLLLSSVGADPAAANAYRRAKGRAEAVVRACGIEHAVLRTTHRYGPGFGGLGELALRWLWWTVVPGDGRQRLAPVAVADVAAALAAADDRAEPVEGTFALGGPDVVTADEVAALAEPRRPRLHAAPGSWLARRLPVRATALEVLAADSLPDAPDAATEFGIAPVPLGAGSPRSGDGR